MKIIKTIFLRSIRRFTGLGILILALVVLASDAFAQRPGATPTTEVPVIISRADDTQIRLESGQTRNEPIGQASGSQIDEIGNRIKELGKRVNTLESTKDNEYDRKQKRLLLNLDILSRAEQRAEGLRKQLFDMIERESAISLRLERLDVDLRPEMIDRTVAFAGTLRPEELRDARRQSLQLEKRNLQDLLSEISTNKNKLQENVRKSDDLVDKLRFKLEKEIDDALKDDDDF